VADSCSTFIAHTRVALSGPLLVVGFIARHDLLLKFTSNMIKYPKNKGIALNLAGPQGAGKSTLVDLLRKLLGKAKVLETTTPEETVWGQFNWPAR
jgi:pantothenate kinase-related protein Tda10